LRSLQILHRENKTGSLVVAEREGCQLRSTVKLCCLTAADRKFETLMSIALQTDRQTEKNVMTIAELTTGMYR